MRDKHIIPTPPYSFVLCTPAYLREEAIIFAGSENNTDAHTQKCAEL